MNQDWQRFRESFEKFIVHDLKKSLEVDIEVGTIILTVIGIECLSGYFAGEPSNGQTFERFVRAFMPKYTSHARTLYQCVRNGLAHDYIIKELFGQSFLFTRNRGEKHLTPVERKPEWYYLNREQFALDFLDAQRDFFDQVNNSQDLLDKAMHRLNQRGFLDVFSFQLTTMFVDSDENRDDYTGVTGTYVNQ